MQVLKPVWVTHNDKPIFSVDIHPDGSRFATGGQGEDAGKIVIWNMSPVRNESEELDNSVPKILCQMDNHLACVNCVRWSGNGRYLASGGDDKLIMIWQTSRVGVGSTVFGSDTKIIESWRPVHTLRSHSGDVLGLAWSPNDVWLASCSIDNTVIVWNAEKFPEQVVVLRGHTGLVKGVTWDPVGKYLASQSDDKTLRVWRTRDWQQEASITAPFKECGGTTHVLRCDWSPDGHYLVSAHAMNNSGPTAQIIERTNWGTSLDFVGHRKAVTVVRFNPYILSKKLNKDAEKPQQYTCCAIGSRDRTLSIWLTALKRPLVVMKDIFTDSILDISWGQNGTELLCCSSDGTVAYFNFNDDELGTPLGKEGMRALLENMYGKCVPQSSGSNKNSEIIESAAVLKLQQQQKLQNQETLDRNRASVGESFHSTPSKSNASMMINGDSKSPFKPTDKQIETKTADGRRRITPIFLSAQSDVGEAPLPFTNKAANIQFESTKGISSILVEKQDKVTHPGLMSPNSNSMHSPPVTKGTPKTSSSTTDVKEFVTTPKVSASTPEVKTPSSKTSPTTSATPVSVNSVVQPLAALDARTPTSKPLATPDRTMKSSEKPTTLSLKRKIGPDGQPRKRGRPRLVDKDNSRAINYTHQTTPVIQPAVEKEVIRYVASSSDLQFPVLSIDKSLSRQIRGQAGDAEKLVVEVQNGIQSAGLTVSRVRCTKEGNLVWEHIVSSKISALACTKYITCVACEDRSLTVIDTSGCKILPSIVLNSQISVLEGNDTYVMAVTRKGSLYVWNMVKQTAVIKNEQLSSLMKNEDRILRARVTSDGIPLLTISTYKSYSFSIDMACWILVHDTNDQVQQCSAHYNSAPKGSGRLSGPLSSLQSVQDKMSMAASRTFQMNPSLKQLSTLNHLENQVASCLFLKSGQEYKFWLLCYVRYLVQEGMQVRLRKICDNLLGPAYPSKRNSSWNEWILGINKRALLKEILPCFGSNLGLQRLYTEYQEQLDTLDNVT